MARGSKRQRGEAWELRVYGGVIDGHEHRVSETFRGSAKAADRRLRVLVDQAEELRNPNATVKVLADSWVEHNRARWSPTTYAAYETDLRLHIIPALGTKPVRVVSVEELDRLYADLEGKGLSPGTIDKIHTILSGMFSLARRWRWIDRSPVEDSDPPAVHVTETSPPKPALVKRILAALAKDYKELALYLRLAAVTGARRGELCALRRSSLDGRVLTIDSAVITVKGEGTRVRATKTHKARRIPLDAHTVTMIEDHWDECVKLAADCGEVLRDGFLFAYDELHAQPWRPDGATSRWTTARGNIKGACKVRVKDLRSYVATQLSDARMPLPTASKRLGHGKDGQTTMKHYAHAVTETDEAAADLLGGLLD